VEKESARKAPPVPDPTPTFELENCERSPQPVRAPIGLPAIWRGAASISGALTFGIRRVVRNVRVLPPFSINTEFEDQND
jgi:hypothetical protein